MMKVFIFRSSGVLLMLMHSFVKLLRLRHRNNKYQGKNEAKEVFPSNRRRRRRRESSNSGTKTISVMNHSVVVVRC